ncbi:hypothetical protein Tco_1272415 [Tanacetum coccineum]
MSDPVVPNLTQSEASASSKKDFRQKAVALSHLGYGRGKRVVLVLQSTGKKKEPGGIPLLDSHHQSSKSKGSRVGVPARSIILRASSSEEPVDMGLERWGGCPHCKSHGPAKNAPTHWKETEGETTLAAKGFSKQAHSDRRKPDRFSLLTKTPKEIFALEKGKFKAPPPMVTPAEKRDPNKYCEFHADTGHSTDECIMAVEYKQIDEMTGGDEDGTALGMINKKPDGSVLPLYTLTGFSTLDVPKHNLNNRQACYKENSVSPITAHGMLKFPAERWMPTLSGKRKEGKHRKSRNKAIQEEVEKLVDVGIMKEVHYHRWLSNPG